MAKKLAIIFILIYTIFFIYQLFISETGDVSLVFAYLNFPTTLITLKTYDALLYFFNIKHDNIIINDIVVYLSGVFQYGLIGYFLGKFV
jgi:hypothetical protein